jgi:hypothetical protein
MTLTYREEERALVAKFSPLKALFNAPPAWLPDKPMVWMDASIFTPLPG